MPRFLSSWFVFQWYLYDASDTQTKSKKRISHFIQTFLMKFCPPILVVTSFEDKSKSKYAKSELNSSSHSPFSEQCHLPWWLPQYQDPPMNHAHRVFTQWWAVLSPNISFAFVFMSCNSNSFWELLLIMGWLLLFDSVRACLARALKTGGTTSMNGNTRAAVLDG